MKNIFYKNALPTIRVKLANFKGVSEDMYSKTLPIDYAFKQENLEVLNGSLVATQSLNNLNIVFDENVKNIIPIYEDRVKLFCDLQSKVCILSTENNEVVKTEIAKDFEIYATTYYKYGDDYFLILATDDGLKKFEKGQFFATEVDSKFNFICNHYYRIFACKENMMKLEFSDDFAPFNWNTSIDEGGYINLPFERGDIIDIFSFNQYLVVCQQYGFTKITAYSEQEDFVVKTISSSSRIKVGSVADCGDYIMFATDKGLGIFDGFNCQIICEELSCFLINCNIRVAVSGEYCYFLCKYDSKQKENLIIAFNIVKKNYHLIACGKTQNILQVRSNGKENLLAVCDDSLKILSDGSSSERKIWKSGILDFGHPSVHKLIKKIEFGGKTILDLKINVDGKNYFFNISHKRNLLLNLKGKEFEIEIVPKGKSINLPSPVLEYQILEEK